MPADVHQFLRATVDVSSNRIRTLQEPVRGKESCCGALLRGAVAGRSTRTRGRASVFSGASVPLGTEIGAASCVVIWMV